MRNLCTLDGCTRYAKINHYCLLHDRLQRIVQKAYVYRNSIDLFSTYQTTYTKQLEMSSITTLSELTSKIKNKNRKCKVTGCTSFPRRYGLCSRHGGSKLCRVDGCSTPAQTGGRCRIHGGGTLCKANGCTSFARFQGHCLEHSGKSEPI
ncbi:hypothetical protein THRCLA_22762 [Thraustotheca clavata]|uniref:Uncharacterized protein n=1 Tax=Thraustotheca clavata TaxID=74557 RepID=A0A1V9YT94_9STRA|nr:hypothetical protein THRCLA_22762 [Thraustotheca clavata]